MNRLTHKFRHILVSFLGILWVLLMVAGCSSSPEFSVIPPTAYVCDPLGGGGSGPANGLVGQLYYLEDNQYPADPLNSNIRVDDIYNIGHTPDVDLFLNQLNVPTRVFTQGFSVSDGFKLKKMNGEILTEWFALRMHSRIVLSANDTPDLYQFALLSDDGAQLVLPDTGEILIDNDGITPTRFMPSDRAVRMKRNTKLNVELKYYQGPRVHIALILMWRKWNGSADDPARGIASNDLYFDATTTPSTPKQAYFDLLSRGWQPLSSENFLLPEGYTNPCP